MNLQEVALDIRNVLDEKRKNIELSFLEEDHIYFMKDKNGNYRNDFPSVSKILKHFYEPFDSEGIAYKKAQGNIDEMKRLLKEWSAAGDYATNMGSRTHFMLESETIERNGGYKQVRQPEYDCDIFQSATSDCMVTAGKKYLDLCEKRNLVLLDTEMVLGDPDLGYVGQPDKVWLTENASGNGYGLLITDWKTNKEKNFKTNDFTKPMYPPFQNYPNNALGHYYLQLPFYGKLLIKMLEGTKYENIKLLGCIVVLLKEDTEFQEFRVPREIIDTINQMDMDMYLS